VSTFTRQMLQGLKPTIFGSGDKTRDYVYVADVVHANLLAMQGNVRGIYNIGTGIETTDKEMFDTLAKILDYKSTPHYAQVRKGEIYRTCLNNSKALKDLGWKPRVSLREGLSRTVCYHKAHFGIV